MIDAYLILCNGFEDIEAIATIDILRRGNVSVRTISISDKREVTSKSGVQILAEDYLSNINKYEAEMIILPGGAIKSGYIECTELLDLLVHYISNNKYIAAICAAPTILGKLGLLKGINATCFTGLESELEGAIISEQLVCKDKTFITSKCAGTTFEFAFEIVKHFKGEEQMNLVKNALYGKLD